LRHFAFFATLFAFSLLASLASAQQADAALGFSALMSPGASTCSPATLTCPEKGGVYPSVNADVIFHRRIGFGYEVAWRGSQGSYFGQPYRPIINAFNAVFQPRISKKVGLDLVAGVGFQDTRYYLPYCTNPVTCSNYTTSKHFLVDIGGGIRYYVWGHMFLRPEVRFYNLHNNTDFTSGNIVRVGASIGYTIGPE